MQLQAKSALALLDPRFLDIARRFRRLYIQGSMKLGQAEFAAVGHCYALIDALSRTDTLKATSQVYRAYVNPRQFVKRYLKGGLMLHPNVWASLLKYCEYALYRHPGVSSTTDEDDWFLITSVLAHLPEASKWEPAGANDSYTATVFVTSELGRCAAAVHFVHQFFESACGCVLNHNVG
jgi:hypothetical protein